MEKLIISFLLIAIFCSFSEQEYLENRSSLLYEDSTIVDKAYIGMTIQELKNKYQDAEFLEEHVYYYGVDGSGNGISVVDHGEKLFFVWTLEDDDKIHSITIISSRITIDDNVHVGMKLNDFHEKYPNGKMAIDMVDTSIEYMYVPGLDYRVEFLTTDSTRVAEYDYGMGEPEFIEVKHPESKINRISIK